MTRNSPRCALAAVLFLAAMLVNPANQAGAANAAAPPQGAPGRAAAVGGAPGNAQPAAQTQLLPQANPAARQWLVLIAIDEYQDNRFCQNLKSCKGDLIALRDLLYQRFGYKSDSTIEMFDAAATRASIEQTMYDLIKKVGAEDTVLVAFSGHGYYDDDAKLGYWYPSEAAAVPSGIPNSEVRDWAKSFKAKKVLVIADSCFSGSLLSRSGFTPDATRKSRELLAAGGLHPVADSGSPDGKHSVFNYYLCDSLRCLAGKNEPFVTNDLYVDLYTPVKSNSSQEPQKGILQDATHEGGQFLFYPILSGQAPSTPSPTPVAPVAPVVLRPTPRPPEGGTTYGGQDYIENAAVLNMKMVWISGNGGYWMGATEVTNGQYKAFLNDSRYDGARDADADYMKNMKGGDSMPTGDEYPVVWVSWNNAKAFCDWLSQKTGRTYTLPTEAQWEYACCAGSTGDYCFGSDARRLGDYAWYSSNSGGKMHPVAQKKPNAWGLYDMHGNVWEWCADWYDSSQNSRVLRGGSWFIYAGFCRSSYRGGYNPTSSNYGLGFRVWRVVSGR